MNAQEKLNYLEKQFEVLSNEADLFGLNNEQEREDYNTMFVFYLREIRKAEKKLKKETCKRCNKIHS